jgi:hypothetical protein
VRGRRTDLQRLLGNVGYLLGRDAADGLISNITKNLSANKKMAVAGKPYACI